MHNPTARLEAFCDGVFAIAITLLILEIKVPAKETINSTHNLAQALAEHWPSWLAFLLSFGAILVAWVNHHQAFKLINKSSSLFIFMNGFFLLTIVVLPYPTSLLAEYINTEYAHTAAMFYCLTMVAHNMGWTFLFQSMLSPKDLSKSQSSRKMIVKTRTQCIYAFFTYLSISVLANWFPLLAVSIIALLYIVWIFVGISIQGKDFETG